MDNNIPEFQGGTASSREKLNWMRALLNRTIRGDEQFISVHDNPTGIVVSLNMQQLLAQIPKYVPKDEFRAVITGNDGAAGPYFYDWIEAQETTNPFYQHGTPVPPWRQGSVAAGTYAVNGWEQSNNYAQPVPNGTLVWIKVTYDQSQPPNAVYRFDYMDMTVGVFCDQAMPVYNDTLNVGAVSFHSDEFSLTSAPIYTAGLISKGIRERVRWNGMFLGKTASAFQSQTACHIKVINFNEPSVYTGTPNVETYDDVTGFNKVPVTWDVTSSSIPNPCTVCDTNNWPTATVKGWVLINPCDYALAIQNNSLPQGQIGTLNIGSGLAVTLTGSGCQQVATLTAVPSIYVLSLVNCDGTPFTGAGTVTGLQALNGLSWTSVVGGTAQLNLNFDVDFQVTIGGSSSGITIGAATWDLSAACLPVLRHHVDLPPYPVPGISLVDCATGALTGVFTTLTGLPGVVLGGTAPNGTIGLNITNGAGGVTVTVTSCGYVVDIPANTFDPYGAAATAQSNAESYTNSQISTLGGVYDPLGAAATAQANAEAYTDSKLYANLINYSASTSTNWSGSPPTDVASALDRIAAALKLAGFPP